MDPFTIAAGVIGIAKSISSVNTGVRWIASLKNAPAEFLDLQNELETVHAYLQTLRPIVENLRKSPDAGSPLPDLTHIAGISRSLAVEVQQLVELTETFRAESVRLDRNGKPRIKKVRWRRNIEIVTSHRDRVRRMRIELASAVGLLQPAQSTLILGVQQASRTELQALRWAIEESTERLHQSIKGLPSSNTPNEAGNPSRLTGVEQASNIAPREIVSIGDPETQETLGCRPTDTNETGQGCIRLEAKLIKRCGVLCLCQCHRSHRIQSNPDQISRPLLGGFLLDYNCIPVWDPRPCNDPRCVNRAGGGPSYISLTYMFPAWLFNRALSLRVLWGSLTDRGASLHIGVPRILPRDHEIFWAIHNARLDIVQANLSSRKVLPTDIDYAGGSLLYVAINISGSYCPDIPALFLQLTKDLNVQDSRGMSAFQAAHFYIRSNTEKRINSPNRPIIERIFRRGVEEYEYPTGETLIHKALFRDGTDLSLEEALALDPSSINTGNYWGFTPLYWACARSDIDAVRVLLDHGADVDARQGRGGTSLLALHGENRDRIADMLLERGADINAENVDGVTALTRAVETEQLGLFIMLLSRGARAVPMKFTRTSTIVHYLCDFPNPPVQVPMLEALVKEGYDINTPNKLGETPLLYSIWYNSAAGVQALADHGADLTVSDKRGRTALHMAAQCGTLDLFRVLEKLLPGAVNPNVVDNEGRVAVDYFRVRLPLPEEEVDAFERMVAAVRRTWEQQAVRITTTVVDDESEDEEDEDEFFDAEDGVEAT